jgi:ubiquinone/menaquinone biosynthesis C-methylase UbiE
MPPDNDSKSLSEERYSKFARAYVNSQSHAKGYDLERLVEISNPQAEWDMLDIATGGGHTALKFAPLVKKVVATDLTENMLQAAGQFVSSQGVGNIEFRQADAEKLPFNEGSFDLVTCRIAAHHFPAVQEFIHESQRVLQPGGVFVLQDHVLPEDEESARKVDMFERRRDPSHNRAFSESEWIEMIKKAGLQVYHHEQITKRHELVAWLERQGHVSEMISAMTEMMDKFPDSVKAWLQPRDWGKETASFVNHHILLVASK